MEDNRCFESGCMLNVEYICPCSSPPIFICKLHALNHMEVHTDIINENNMSLRDFEEWNNKTKLKTEKEISFIGSQISNIIEEFNHKFKEVEKVKRNNKNIIVEEDLKEKSDVLKSSNNNSDLDRERKGLFSACKSDSRAPEISVTKSYLDIVNTYQQKPYLFNINAVKWDNRTNLLIYNTEIENQSSHILETSQPLGWGTCITQLPNGKLFCFGNFPISGITFLIDENYRVQELPSGTTCACSSAIYFNNNVYCFGGLFNYNCLNLSSRFDLDRNQWNELTPLPKADSSCNSIIYNGNILISGLDNKNLFRYSIDNNSFSTIPYNFAEFKRKILINAERLYLIECQNGPIYESDIGSDTAWRKITTNSAINILPFQTYWQYIKEEIYIGCIYGSIYSCFKFNLHKKRLIKLV